MGGKGWGDRRHAVPVGIFLGRVRSTSSVEVTGKEQEEEDRGAVGVPRGGRVFLSIGRVFLIL